MARILLIEDSPTDTAVLTQLLERNGHDVLASGSAEDGIDMCRGLQHDRVLDVSRQLYCRDDLHFRQVRARFSARVPNHERVRHGPNEQSQQQLGLGRRWRRA